MKIDSFLYLDHVKINIKINILRNKLRSHDIGRNHALRIGKYSNFS